VAHQKRRHSHLADAGRDPIDEEKEDQEKAIGESYQPQENEGAERSGDYHDAFMREAISQVSRGYRHDQ
jgi:hypothetical protein